MQSWLSDRTACVALRGKLSKDTNMHNMVYQGIVLSQQLWTICDADTAFAVNLVGFLEIIFADDLNCYKDFGIHIPNPSLNAEMRRCQGELHKWGRANQINLDPTNKSQHILRLNAGEGQNCRFL